ARIVRGGCGASENEAEFRSNARQPLIAVDHRPLFASIVKPKADQAFAVASKGDSAKRRVVMASAIHSEAYFFFDGFFGA
ncbi:MAG: hypothetical protein Q3982_06870, partial [Phoenicibacter congonensis]|nr:hypothetical protein [Phoenicibacter congonensis]